MGNEKSDYMALTLMAIAARLIAEGDGGERRTLAGWVERECEPIARASEHAEELADAARARFSRPALKDGPVVAGVAALGCLRASAVMVGERLREYAP